MALALFAASAARADIFSPGPLARPHEKWEGLANCTKCHVAGSRLSNDTCLACHAELKDRLALRRGFHGRLAPAELACNRCHHEHQGRDASLVDWGASGQKGFDHAKTGFPLKGKHAGADCAKCHDDKLIVDPAVRALRKEQPGRATFLGAPAQCAACHFDEHRGQAGRDCAKCHTDARWKPAPGFSHARTDFPLLGKHAEVDCVKCHAQVADTKSYRNALLRPRSTEFLRFRPVAHDSCADCHKDPHQGRLGASCASCHSASGWTEVKATTTGARAFHEQTRYPLRGAHAAVACQSCHGPWKGQAAVFKGLRFAACADCHVDAHLGQLGTPPRACDSCHGIQSFLPSLYDPAEHKRYPLSGAHAAVACSECHRSDPTLAAKTSLLRAFLEKRKRSDTLSLTRFAWFGNVQRCDACHVDPHRGQFASRVKQSGCADCHSVDSFSTLRFDHARDTSFALTGAHQRAACAACHVTDASATVRYKGTAADCASCHADPHVGQFAAAPGRRSDCAACHSTAEWKRTSFVHRAPYTRFELEGKHGALDCTACHRDLRVGANAIARQYRGLPTTCAGCHVDVHRGAFREFVQ